MPAKTLSELSRSFFRAIEKGKGIRLEAADVDMLCAAGVLDVLHSAAAEEQRAKAMERLHRKSEAARSTLEASVDADEALLRARRATRRLNSRNGR